MVCVWEGAGRLNDTPYELVGRTEADDSDALCEWCAGSDQILWVELGAAEESEADALWEW